MKKYLIVKHLIVLSLTVAIFFAVFRFVSFENAVKRREISLLQENVLIDLMANETQFELLKSAPCDSLIEGSSLASKMDEIGRKLTFAENHDDNIVEINSLKKYYSLLEIKDYLLSREIVKKCPGANIHSIVYFYREDCKPCVRQGYVLSEVKKRYPWVRIYSFDYDLDFPIIKSFGDIYHVSEGEFPVLILDGDSIHHGFMFAEDIENAIPQLREEKVLHDFLTFLKEERRREELTLEDLSCERIEGSEQVRYLCTVAGEGENRGEEYEFDGEHFSPRENDIDGKEQKGD